MTSHLDAQKEKLRRQASALAKEVYGEDWRLFPNPNALRRRIFLHPENALRELADALRARQERAKPHMRW